MACNEWGVGPHGGAGGHSRTAAAAAAERLGDACRCPARMCWSPPARRMSRSTPSATSPTAPRAGRALPSPPQRLRSGRARDAGFRAGRHCPARRRDGRFASKPPATCSPHVERRCPPTSAIFAAAVADWRSAANHDEKIKKGGKGKAPALALVENPDILATIAKHASLRPPLVIGFAAETENVVGYARKKLAAKGCDWIVANDVSLERGVMGGRENQVQLVTAQGVESWPKMSKEAVAAELMRRAAAFLARGRTPGTRRRRSSVMLTMPFSRNGRHAVIRLQRLPHVGRFAAAQLSDGAGGGHGPHRRAGRG